MLKYSHFSHETEHGVSAIPLFGKADGEFEKCASSGLLPDVVQYIEGLRPSNTSQYVLVNAMGAGEYFGCFPAGTLVETAGDGGEQPIESVEPGHLVRTHLNRYREVLARVPRQAEELCDLYVQGLPSDLPSLSATPNHELWVVTREDFVQTKRRVVWKGDTGVPLEQRREQAMRELEFSWLPISDLRAGDYISEPFPLEDDPCALGDVKWNCPEVAFLMGLYAAEGCVARRYDRDDDRPASIIYVVSGEETAVIERARAHAEKLGHGLQDYKSPSGTSYRLQLCFAELARLCEQHIGTPAVDKKLSTAALRMPRGWQKVFLAAYAAGDGCVRKGGKEEGATRMVSASAALLRGMRLMLARQGLVGSINGRHDTKASWYNGNPIYELSVSGGQLKGRGTPKSYIHPSGYILSSVKRVEQYAWEGTVYDLTVAEDSSFVASGVAVHNSNINGDHFPEASLIHRPDEWTGNPLIDKVAAKSWAYGYPTFYNAHPYAHHRNKDASRAFGEVELATWNDNMKRVELVVRVDHAKCMKFGGTGVWDKLRMGQYPDVSMGTKVPYDTCSICLDWDTYQTGLATFDPKKHPHPGAAALAYHKSLLAKGGKGIRGLSITRKDYCEHARREMSRIYPDGRKVWVYNDFPRFFDISFVFIGADKTAKVMLFIYRNGGIYSVKPSAQVAEELGVEDAGAGEKTASVSDELLAMTFGKLAKRKSGEMDKRVVPSQFAGKAVPTLTKKEPDLPTSILDGMGGLPLDQVLSTTGGMGMVLKPREFQRIVLVRLGQKGLADSLDQQGKVFCRSDDTDATSMGPGSFAPALARLLLPFLALRSALGPVIEKRVLIVAGQPPGKDKKATSHTSELMDKIGAAYNGYRHSLMELIAHSPDLLTTSTGDVELQKLGSTALEEVFTPLSVAYLKHAHLDAFGLLDGGVVKLSNGTSLRGEGIPLGEHVAG